MNERESIRRAFAPLHASEDTLEEVLDMIEREKYGRKRHTGRKVIRTALVAAVMVMVLTVTAYAVGEYTGFFEKVFGDEDIASWDTEHVTLTDEHGNVWKEYNIPGQERVPVDTDQAEALVGDETASVDKSVKVQDVTFTVENIVMDANGMGVLTYTMEDPNGFPGTEFTENGQMLTPDPTVVGSLRVADLWFADANGKEMQFLDSYDFVTAEGTDTRKTVVKYFAPFDGLEQAENLKLTFRVVKDPDATLAADEVAEGGVIFPLSQAVAITPLTGPEGWSAGISPVGLKITPPEGNPYGDNYTGTVVIHMTDGTEYALTQAEPYVDNTTVACFDENDAVNYVFNRLIDPDQVESVTFSGEGSFYVDESGQPVPYDESWVEVEPELVGDTWTSSTELREGLTDRTADLDLTFTK